MKPTLTIALEGPVDRETVVNNITPIRGVLGVMVENGDIVITTTSTRLTEDSIRHLISKTRWDVEYVEEINGRDQIAVSC